MVKMLMKSLISKMLNVPMVIEEGTSGAWKYRKWSTGKVEAWGRISVGTVEITTSAPSFGGYRTLEIGLTIPSGIFSSTPRAVAVKSAAQAGGLYNLWATSATRLACYYWAGASTTATNQTIDVYAWTN